MPKGESNLNISVRQWESLAQFMSNDEYFTYRRLNEDQKLFTSKYIVADGEIPKERREWLILFKMYLSDALSLDVPTSVDVFRNQSVDARLTFFAAKLRKAVGAFKVILNI